MDLISMSEWMLLHPYKTPNRIDYTYFDVVKKLFNCWQSSLMNYRVEGTCAETLTYSVGAYFEDVVSQIGLWKAFTDKHQKMYGKPLPFYNTDADHYFRDEINVEDIAFIIWSSVQKENPTEIMDPESLPIMDLAQRFYEVLDAEFEKVPQNNFCMSYLQRKEHYKNFFSFKKMAYWLFYESYLLGYENSILLLEELEMVDEDNQPTKIEYAVRSESIFGRNSGPLALPLIEWYAGLLSNHNMDKEIAIIKAIENRTFNHYLILKIDKKYIYLQDLQKQEYAILRSSFQFIPKDVHELKTIKISIVKYNGEWNANGASVWGSEEEEYHTLVRYKEIKDQEIKRIYESILKVNDNSPIAYFKNQKEMQKWISTNLPILNDTKNLGINKNDNIVLFASPNESLKFITQAGLYIKDPKNPYFDASHAMLNGSFLLTNADIFPSIMYRYLLEHDMLPEMVLESHPDEKRAKEMMQNNVDFIARYFRWDRF